MSHNRRRLPPAACRLPPAAARLEPACLQPSLPCSQPPTSLCTCRCRFSTTCRAARQLVCGSPCPQIYVQTYSRKQSLALLRWLVAACRGSPQLFLLLRAQQVPFIRQLQQGISMQAACVEHLMIG